MVVVFSAVVGYVVAAGTQIQWLELLALAFGGFCVTACANALNEVFEKDFDKLMKRTAVRPLPSERMKPSEALLASGVMGLIGLGLMWYFFGALTVALAAISIISYAFIYTPLKRISPIAVFVGAIPGALPPVIGWVAFTGTIGIEAVILFIVQFIWQFPHFWAIGWLGHDDYQKAGFKLLPNNSGKTKSTAIHSMVYIILLIPMVLLGVYFGLGYRLTAIMAFVAGIMYLYPAIQLYKRCDDKAALKLMFASFFYLPLMQISWMIDRFWI